MRSMYLYGRTLSGATKPIWALWKREKPIAPAGNWTQLLAHLAHSLTAKMAEVSWLPIINKPYPYFNIGYITKNGHFWQTYTALPYKLQLMKLTRLFSSRLYCRCNWQQCHLPEDWASLASAVNPGFQFLWSCFSQGIGISSSQVLPSSQ